MDTTKVLDESKVIDFNNIVVNDDKYEFLKNLYMTYHRRANIYKKNYKMFNAVNILTNIFLSIVTSATIVTAITVAPVVSILSVASIISIGAQKGLKIEQRMERSRLIFNIYSEILIKLKSYIRGTKYNHNDLLTEINQIELLINDLGVIPSPRCEKEYKKKYYK